MKYVPQLDGLRAIAILFVMVFHLGVFPLGWVGVPLFFVLSGYLITTILVADRSKSLRDFLARFYWRRTVRIFPLYYLYVLIIAVAAILFGYSLNGYGWFLAYLGNYQIALSQDVPAGGLVAHLWSLAVEEQFYLIWPFVVFFSRRVWPWALAAIVAAPLFREVVLQSAGNAALAIVALLVAWTCLQQVLLLRSSKTTECSLLWLCAALRSSPGV